MRIKYKFDTTDVPAVIHGAPIRITREQLEELNLYPLRPVEMVRYVLNTKTGECICLGKEPKRKDKNEILF